MQLNRHPAGDPARTLQSSLGFPCLAAQSLMRKRLARNAADRTQAADALLQPVRIKAPMIAQRASRR
jgi:hypothetical protein